MAKGETWADKKKKSLSLWILSIFCFIHAFYACFSLFLLFFRLFISRKFILAKRFVFKRIRSQIQFLSCVFLRCSFLFLYTLFLYFVVVFFLALANVSASAENCTFSRPLIISKSFIFSCLPYNIINIKHFLYSVNGVWKLLLKKKLIFYFWLSCSFLIVKYFFLKTKITQLIELSSILKSNFHTKIHKVKTILTFSSIITTTTLFGC